MAKIAVTSLPLQQTPLDTLWYGIYNIGMVVHSIDHDHDVRDDHDVIRLNPYYHSTPPISNYYIFFLISTANSQ
jgi:hypothetical protein